MTAPPTIPETFNLRPATPGSLSSVDPTYGAMYYSGTPYGSSGGARPGTSGSGAPGTAGASERLVLWQETSARSVGSMGSGSYGYHHGASGGGAATPSGSVGGTPALAGSGGSRTRGSRTRSRTVDRFRWSTAAAQNSGFGYSWDSEEEAEEDEEEGGPRDEDRLPSSDSQTALDAKVRCRHVPGHLCASTSSGIAAALVVSVYTFAYCL